MASPSLPAQSPSSAGPQSLPQTQTKPRGALLFAQPEQEMNPYDQQDGSPSLDGATRAELPDPIEDDRSSSPGSSTRAPAGSAKVLREAVRSGVGMAGGFAHQLLARDQAAVDVGLYLVDADDAEAIGDPLAAIAQRRGGIGVAGNPDLADAIACLIGLALYATKQFVRWADAKQRRQILAQGGVPTPQTDQAAGDRPQDDFEPAVGAPTRFGTSTEAFGASA